MRLAILSPLIIAMTLFASACGDRPHLPPTLEVGALEGITADDPDIALIMEALQNLLLVVDQKRLDELPEMVSEKKGVYVDLKSHRARADLSREIADADGYLPMYYTDTDRLRAQTGDDTQLSVRDVIRTTSLLRVDFFREGQDEIELKLHLADNPDESYRLNNPVFIREDGRWLVYRLF